MQAHAHGDDRLHDGFRLRVTFHVADETAVDLDLVEWKAAQVAQAGIAGAEIVHRQAYAELLELRQDLKRLLLVIDKNGFSDLQFQPFRRQPGAKKHLRDRGNKARVVELDRRKIDRDRGGSLPGHSLGAGGRQHPGSNRNDQAGFLGDRYEVGGRDASSFRMIPAQQRFIAGDFKRHRVDDRLIVQREVALFQRHAQIPAQDLALAQPLVHARLEGTPAVPAVLSRLRGCQRRVAHQLARAGSIGRVDRDPDVEVQFHRLVIDAELRTDLIQNPFNQGDRVDLAARHDLQNGEFIALQAANRIGPPDYAIEPLRKLDQQGFRGGQPDQLAHRLEAVQPDVQDGEAGLPPIRLQQRLLNLMLERIAVHQSGQRIEAIEAFDQRLRRLFTRKITHRDNMTGPVRIFAPQHLHRPGMAVRPQNGCFRDPPPIRGVQRESRQDFGQRQSGQFLGCSACQLTRREIGISDAAVPHQDQSLERRVGQRAETVCLGDQPFCLALIQQRGPDGKRQDDQARADRGDNQQRVRNYIRRDRQARRELKTHPRHAQHVD